MPAVKTQVNYSNEEIATLTKIAKENRSNWNTLITDFCKSSGRTYAGAYYKTSMIANNEVGNTVKNRSKRQKAVKKGIQNSPKRVGKSIAKSKNREVIKYVSKGSNMHPMKHANTLAVRPHEIRFPYKGIRLEGGEVIISI